MEFVSNDPEKILESVRSFIQFMFYDGTSQNDPLCIHCQLPRKDHIEGGPDRPKARTFCLGWYENFISGGITLSYGK